MGCAAGSAGRPRRPRPGQCSQLLHLPDLQPLSQLQHVNSPGARKVTTSEFMGWCGGSVLLELVPWAFRSLHPEADYQSRSHSCWLLHHLAHLGRTQPAVERACADGASSALAAALVTERDGANFLHAAGALGMLLERGQPSALIAMDASEQPLLAIRRAMGRAAMAGAGMMTVAAGPPVAGLLECGAALLHGLARWREPAGCAALLAAAAPELGMAIAGHDGRSTLLATKAARLLVERAGDVETAAAAAVAAPGFCAGLFGVLDGMDPHAAAAAVDTLLLLGERGGDRVVQQLLRLCCNRHLCAATPPLLGVAASAASVVAATRLRVAAAFFSKQTAQNSNTRDGSGRARAEEADERTRKLILQRTALRRARAEGIS